MKTRQLLPLLGAGPLVLSLASGCIFLPVPEPEPTPKPPAPLPKVIFDPADGQERGLALNNPAAGATVNTLPTPGAPTPVPPLPSAFRVARVDSGDTVVLQSVKKTTNAKGEPVNVLGAPDVNNPVRLAGIIAPKLPTPGAQNSINTLFKWVAGKDLDVDIDPQYPADTDGIRLVHIFYKGQPRKNPATGGQDTPTLSLNRMMVRSGYAIVDLYSPTSFDQKQWLLDEAYAREHRAGLWKTNVFPALQQRLPSTGTGRRSQVTIRPGAAPSGAPGMPGAPGVPGVPGGPAGMPGAPMPGGAPAAPPAAP